MNDKLSGFYDYGGPKDKKPSKAGRLSTAMGAVLFFGIAVLLGLYTLVVIASDGGGWFVLLSFGVPALLSFGLGILFLANTLR